MYDMFRAPHILKRIRCSQFAYDSRVRLFWAYINVVFVALMTPPSRQLFRQALYVECEPGS